MPKTPVKKNTKKTTGANGAPIAPLSPATPAPPAVESRPSDTSRPIKYPKIEPYDYSGDNAVTVSDAKDWLGWEEETDKVKFGDKFLTYDMTGKKIRCTNDTHNRPFRRERSLKYAYTVLNRQWSGPNGTGFHDDPDDPWKKTVNCEPMVIGRTGLTIQCQHRLIGLVFAAQIWHGLAKPDTSEHWKEIWLKEPVMDSIVIFGCDESGITTRTFDTGDPRTEDDVYFTDANCFGDMDNWQRRELCRILKFAVKLLWSRTGAKGNLYRPFKTIAEAMSWVDRHPRILQAVQFIWESNLGVKGKDGKKGPDNRIQKYLSPGYAAALLYLMGCSESEGAPYQLEVKNGTASEGILDWSNWEKACEFWLNFANLEPSFAPIRDCRRPFASGEQDNYIMTVRGPGTADTGGSDEERIGTLVKAWKCFAAGEPITEADIVLQYDGITTPPFFNPKRKDDLPNVLTDYPDLGGIDLGDPEMIDSLRADYEAMGEGEEEEDDVLTEEEVERRKAEIELEREKANQDRLKRLEEEEERRKQGERKQSQRKKRPLSPAGHFTPGETVGTIEEELNGAPPATDGLDPTITPQERPADPRLPVAPKPRKPITRKGS